MDHNERTETENAINRKLNIVQITVIELLKMARAIPGVGPDVRQQVLDRLVTELEQVWKEDEDE